MEEECCEVMCMLKIDYDYWEIGFYKIILYEVNFYLVILVFVK